MRTEPDNRARKRIKKINQNSYVISYRTWRIEYGIDFFKYRVTISKILTGYEQHEFDSALDDDVFNDKEIHKLFMEKYYRN